MHTIIILPIALQAAGNAVALEHFDPIGGGETFASVAADVGNPSVITHCWCAAPFSNEKRALLDTLAATPPFAGNIVIEDFDANTHPGFPHTKLAELGLAVYSPADAP